jgi:hypothetical protein
MFRSKITPIIAVTALVVAVFGATPLGQAASRLVLPKNSVGAAQIKKNALADKKIAKNAITSPKVKDGSLLAADFKAGQLPAGPTGPRGLQGLQGEKGAKGDPGPERSRDGRSLEQHQQQLPEGGHRTLPRRQTGDRHRCVHRRGVSDSSRGGHDPESRHERRGRRRVRDCRDPEQLAGDGAGDLRDRRLVRRCAWEDSNLRPTA